VFTLLFKHSPFAYQAGEYAFASSWPLWLLYALIALGAVLVTVSLLRQKQLAWWQRLLLGTLQTALLAVLLVMLWRPVLIVERVRDRENVVAVVMDASASMAHGEAEKPRLREAVEALSSGPIEALGKTFAVRLFGFANDVEPIKTLTEVPPPGPQTRIGDALRAVLQTGASVPLAGIVIVTDGAENGGTLSEERLTEIASFGVPVHTVGVGPERNSNDLELDAIRLPQEATPGETLTAEVSIRHDAKARTRLRVYDGDKLLASKMLDLSADAGITTNTVEFPSGVAGVRDLRFTLDPLEGERNVINNSRTHVIDVNLRRRHILYIEGEPRWEYKFIRRAAETDKSLRLASVVRATPNRYYRQGVESPNELAAGFPKTTQELFAFDAVVIGSFEAAALSTEQHQSLRDFVDRRGGGLLMLAGRDGLSDGGWAKAPVAQTLPARLAEGSAKTFSVTPVKARLTVYGAESAINRLDDDPRRNTARWNELPELADIQPLGRLKPGAVVLLEAVERNRPQPLLVWQHYGRGTTYLFSTASTWRWKMRLPHEDQRHYTFWRQLLHAVASDAPPRATLTAERKVYDDERRIALYAELRDDQYKPLSDATVDLTVVSDQGTSSTQTMTASGDGDGRYRAIVDADPAGLYRVSMNAHRGQEALGSIETHFRRNDGVVEHFGTQQNRALLERIAATTGGRYWRLDDLAGLPDAMRYSKAGIVERQTLDLWNLPAVFLLLLLLKAAEWLLRLRWRRL
jgi:uncharacterized membrane protein